MSRYRFAVYCLGSFLLLTVFAKAQSSQDLEVLNQQFLQFYRTGKFAEAMSAAERYAQEASRHDTENMHYATALNRLALVYGTQGRYEEAESHFKRAIALTERIIGQDHEDVARFLESLATYYLLRGRPRDAEPLYTRILRIQAHKFGEESPMTAATLKKIGGVYRSLRQYEKAESALRRSATIRQNIRPIEPIGVTESLNDLGDLYRHIGRYTEAAQVFDEALSVCEKQLGLEHAQVAKILNNQGGLYRVQGLYIQAEASFTRALAVAEKALGPEDPLVSTILDNLGGVYEAQSRYAEAEPLVARALAINEKTFGPDDPRVAPSLNNLAALYEAQGKYADAELFFKRSLANWERIGPEFIDIAFAVNNLANVYALQGRYADAEPLYNRALRIYEKTIGSNHVQFGQVLQNLAGVYRRQGRYTEAEPLYKRGLEIWEGAFGSEHQYVAYKLHSLASFYRDQRRYAEAESFGRRALAIAEKEFEADHEYLAAITANLAAISFSQANWARSVELLKRSTSITVLRSKKTNETIGQFLIGQRQSEIERTKLDFKLLIKAAWHRAAEINSLDDRAELMELAFKAAQRILFSDAATSIAKMAARQAKGDVHLSLLIRERQDRVNQWQAADQSLVAMISRPTSEREAGLEAEMRRRLMAESSRIDEIDGILASQFPEYTSLVNPQPLNVAEVQALLSPMETLIFTLDTPQYGTELEESFIWAITKTAVRWTRIDAGTEALSREVQALRCGLDSAVWAAGGCPGLHGSAGGPYERVATTPLPFDLEHAHSLYQMLFGGIDDLVSGDKTLLIVPSGPLTSLPLHVLVTEKPNSELSGPVAYREAKWLGLRQAIFVLPSISSLQSLRRSRAGTQSSELYIGFGDPILSGGPRCAKSVGWTSCSEGAVAELNVKERRLPQRAGSVSIFSSYFRGPFADVAAVRSLCPLPDTAHELKCVARSLGIADNNVVIGPLATETAVKRAPLDRYRIIHFATHGLLAGQLDKVTQGLAEPALVLTPPDVATEEDDGLLTASEIAQLKLNADWIILSACNTAAGEKSGGHALSGLARAFFYAGARALLVSHWEVDSVAAVILITGTFDEMKNHTGIGRAEALRRAMIKLVRSNNLEASHPSIWAPFIVAGEGGN